MKLILVFILLLPSLVLAKDSVFVILSFYSAVEKKEEIAKLRITKKFFESRNETGLSFLCRSKTDTQKTQYRIIDGDVSYITRSSDNTQTRPIVATKITNIDNFLTAIDYSEPEWLPSSNVMAFYGEQKFKDIVRENPEMPSLEDLLEIIPSSKSKVLAYNSFYCLYIKNGKIVDPPK